MAPIPSSSFRGSLRQGEQDHAEDRADEQRDHVIDHVVSFLSSRCCCRYSAVYATSAQSRSRRRRCVQARATIAHAWAKISSGAAAVEGATLTSAIVVSSV